jgi:hypothetical protein
VSNTTSFSASETAPPLVQTTSIETKSTLAPTTTTFALNPCFGFNCNAGEFCIEAPEPKCLRNVGFKNVSDKVENKLKITF